MPTPTADLRRTAPTVQPSEPQALATALSEAGRPGRAGSASAVAPVDSSKTQSGAVSCCPTGGVRPSPPHTEPHLPSAVDKLAQAGRAFAALAEGSEVGAGPYLDQEKANPNLLSPCSMGDRPPGGDSPKSRVPPKGKVGRPRKDPLLVFKRAVEVPRRGVPYSSPDGYCTRSRRERVLSCTSNINHGPFRQVVPCGTLRCDDCKERVKKRRGSRYHAQLGGVPLAAVVLTVPAQLRRHLGYEQLKELRRWAADVVKEWGLRCWGLELGFLISLHPAGDRSPERYSPHFHVDAPLVGRNPETGQLVDLPKKRELGELDDLRGLWHAKLLPLLELHGIEVSAVNIHYSFRPVGRRLAHRLSYDTRPWPEWSAGGLPSGLGPRPYGLMAPRTKDSEEWKAYVAAPEEEREERRTACPVCGSGLIQLQRPSGKPFILVVGSGEWEQWRWVTPLLDPDGKLVEGMGACLPLARGSPPPRRVSGGGAAGRLSSLPPRPRIKPPTVAPRQSSKPLGGVSVGPCRTRGPKGAECWTAARVRRPLGVAALRGAGLGRRARAPGRTGGVPLRTDSWNQNQA